MFVPMQIRLRKSPTSDSGSFASLNWRKTCSAAPLALCVVSSGALAQTITDIDQRAGSQNEAEIVQQDAQQGIAHIGQEGDMNYGHVLQIGPTGERLYVWMNQNGNNNTATTEQSNVLGTAHIEIYQSGNNLTFEEQQTDVVDASTIVYQWGETNGTQIEQTGDDLITTVRQSGMDNQIVIYQNGTGLQANIVNYLSDGNVINVMQQGTNHQIDFNQEESHNNAINLYQEGGDSNSIQISQSYSQDSTTDITQIASYGTSVSINNLLAVQDSAVIITQNNVSNGLVEIENHSIASRAEIRQGDGSGSSNLIAAIYQRGNTTNGVALIEQHFSDNEATINQYEADNSEAIILQEASGGYAYINQVPLGLGINNSAIITQTADGYSASISQQGDNSVARITQM